MHKGKTIKFNIWDTAG